MRRALPLAAAALASVIFFWFIGPLSLAAAFILSIGAWGYAVYRLLK